VSSPGEPSGVALLEHTLRVDAVTAKVCTALSAAGIPSVLLKGRAFARELYASPLERPFGDTDLLVRDGDLERAEAVLAGELGYRRATPGEEETDPVWQRHAHNWVPAQGGGTPVELHWTVVGAGAPASTLWRELEPHARPLALGAGQVRALAGPATAWLAAMHAAQHGAGEARPLQDLDRALAVLSALDWQAAAALAARVDSTGAFAQGLRLTPRGAAMAAALGLPEETSVMTRLLAANAPAGSQVIEAVTGADGPGGAVRAIRRSLFPRPTRLRGLDPLARRGALGLVAAYVRRPVLVVWRIGPSWRAWKAARSAPRPTDGA
jgi:hypothetical protein